MAKQLHQREHNTVENERSPLCEQASYRCIHGQTTASERNIIQWRMDAVPYVSRHHIGVYMAKQLHQREHNTVENERSPLCEQASYRCIHG